ncbi:vegetative cell wall protein gp1-like [Triticum aestivum]|uniref:vegetative cell wall protein gp1-like n=1 Tax=Triticum aestivum TaxID=4565 RepID=UPI001D016FE0|nr:vegetative cell wall protein gp1-like [Triticum aestivum]XP_045083178.1 vegetative cell wall protein gp1-like [Aegilops tauschii subsp. strangulata]
MPWPPEFFHAGLLPRLPDPNWPGSASPATKLVPAPPSCIKPCASPPLRTSLPRRVPVVPRPPVSVRPATSSSSPEREFHRVPRRTLRQSSNSVGIDGIRVALLVPPPACVRSRRPQLAWCAAKPSSPASPASACGDDDQRQSRSCLCSRGGDCSRDGRVDRAPSPRSIQPAQPACFCQGPAQRAFFLSPAAPPPTWASAHGEQPSSIRFGLSCFFLLWTNLPINPETANFAE